MTAGRYVFYGATLRNPSSGLEMARLFFRHIRIQGTTMGTLEEFNTMMSFLCDNQIVPVVDKVFPLESAVEAHKFMQNFSQTGKIVLTNK
jgi:zinc-binding alcohol dehydrogenase/oxidoreductase